MAERSGINPETLLILGGIGIAGYLVYQVVQGIKGAAGAVGSAAATVAKDVYAGAQFVTAPVSTGIADVVLTLKPLPPAMGMTGNVLFPDATAAPITAYKLLGDGKGNVFVKDRGSTWQLGQSDADGDWPATYVSG